MKLVGTDEQVVYQEAKTLLTDSDAYHAMAHAQNPYGDGQASRRIVEAIAYEMRQSDKTRYVYSKINKRQKALKRCFFCVSYFEESIRQKC